jgi:hypothetical protein
MSHALLGIRRRLRIWQLATDNWLLFQGLGLFDEHDGDVVLDFIEEAALVADEAVARLVQADVPFTLGAGQNLQQLLANGHLYLRFKKYSASLAANAVHLNLGHADFQ